MSKNYYTRRTVKSIEPMGVVTSSTQIIIDTAQSLGIQAKLIPHTRIFELIYNGHKEYFHQQVPPSTSALGFMICNDKRVTKNLLTNNKIMTPNGFMLTSEDPKSYQRKVFNHLQKPLVVKPLNGAHGKHVITKVEDIDTYFEALEMIFKNDENAIVEEMFDGKEYRILATKSKVLGIVEREPANIVGDGNLTIEELIQEKNSDIRRGEHADHPALFKIEIDQDLKDYLSEQDLSLLNVPAKQQKTFLRKVSNISQGGDSIDATDIAHPSINQIAIDCINSVPGLAIAGIDIISKDITKTQSKMTYRVIELNASPGMDIHKFPYKGKSREVFKEFIKLMFPELKV